MGWISGGFLDRRLGPLLHRRRRRRRRGGLRRGFSPRRHDLGLRFLCRPGSRRRSRFFLHHNYLTAFAVFRGRTVFASFGRSFMFALGPLDEFNLGFLGIL
jgi:hypothetical protein